jgi:SNF2 family DNA or RNA helicase
VKSPFTLKDEIKAMAGSKWHGYDPVNPKKVWSALDCERNRFQLQYLQGQNPYAHWDRPLEHWVYDRPLREHQVLMADHMLTYHYCVIAAEMGTGKTLSAIEAMEQSGHKDWWWIGPKSALAAVDREFQKWGLSDDIDLTVMTYDKLRTIMRNWQESDTPPPAVVFDESSRLKNGTAQRTQAAQNLANCIRDHYGKDGFAILMSGTPAPKIPTNWWSQVEIAWPGFLREGSMKAFEWRMALFAEKETMQGKHFQRVTWLDDVNKCKICGGYEDEEQHNPNFMMDDYHQFEESFNEVAFLYERLAGLTLVLRKKDCLDLPDKQYKTIHLEPSATITRVAKALAKVAPNVITGLTWLRELSDGFQYRNVEDGVEKCSVCEDGVTEIWVDPEDSDRKFEMVDMLDSEYVETLRKEKVECPRCSGTCEVPKIVRVTKEVPCPKDAALRDLLEENEEQGRLVVFAGFTGTIDRIVKNCLKDKWAVVRIDGRGWVVYDMDGETVRQEKPLDYWADLANNPRVVIVAHPQSGGLGLTLTEARMAVFFSNDFSAESRSQAEDRIHRIGMDENLGATIVDLIHLPTDERVRDVLKENKKLESMTLGELDGVFGDD